MHALVTGANRGLGLELVRQLLGRGDRVVATARQPGRAQALNALAAEHPGHLHLLPLDVAHPASIRELASEAGLVCEHIDLLLNNAGVLVPGERFGAVTPEALESSLRVNTMAPLLLTQALAGRLADGARVVNVSSLIGSIASVEEFRTPSYAISKAALNMATAQLARALAERGIVVAAISPGWVRTDMGGPNAELAPEQSVAALLAVIDALGPEHSGGFFDRKGKPLPW